MQKKKLKKAAVSRPGKGTEPVGALRRGRHSLAAPLGGAILLLALVGLISILVVGVRLTVSLLDNTKQKEEMERFILPVLMYDPAPFEGVENADPSMILHASVWSALLTNGVESYKYDEMGYLIVSASDVEVAGTRLFGPNLTLNHSSVEGFDLRFIYDEEIKSYHISLSAQMSVYSPLVERIVRKGDLCQLTVGYVPPGSNWLSSVDGEHHSPKPDKWMIYELRMTGAKNYYLNAVREIPSSSGSDTAASS